MTIGASRCAAELCEAQDRVFSTATIRLRCEHSSINHMTTYATNP